MVTVVGADHQTVLARMAQDVRKVVRILAGYPHVICGERVRRKRPALASIAVGQVVQNIGHPLRADLDKAPTDFRELFWQLLFEQRMTRTDDSQLALGKSGVVGEEIMMEKAAVGRMDADGQVQLCGDLPERIKIRVAERSI